jgi:hypothetical protein
MAEQNAMSVHGVRGMNHVTLRVPARYAERFRAQAVQVLGSIAGSIRDTTDKIEQAVPEFDPPVRDVDAQDLALLDAAKSVLVQSREQRGELRIEAPAYTLREVVAGCASEAAEELFHGLSNFDFNPEEMLNEVEHFHGSVEYLSDRIEEEE